MSEEISDYKYLSSTRKKRIILNLRGVKFDVLLETLDKIPNNRLDRLQKLIQTSNQKNLTINDELLQICDDYDLVRNEYYFNRDPLIFNQILNYYATENLHIDDSNCLSLYTSELTYWMIDDVLVEKCCDWKYLSLKHDIRNEISKREKLLDEYLLTHEKISFNNFFFPELRKKLWFMLEKPSDSLYARVFLLFFQIIKRKLFFSKSFSFQKDIFYFFCVYDFDLYNYIGFEYVARV
jgi:hypothetical protein